ncbi:MAG: DUF86 domain-containing protein [Flavobacteriales bacterium]|nr:DUF86 domain-containing protein [Flavobacteriales bacterium]
MLERDVLILEECLYAVRHILEYAQDIQDMTSLEADSKTYDAVLLNFIVLGESANKLSEATKKLSPETDWRAIKDFRNFIAHDYFGLDKDVIWSAIQYHLPRLKDELERLIKERE